MLILKYISFIKFKIFMQKDCEEFSKKILKCLFKN